MFLNFEHFSFSVGKYNDGYLGWNSQNRCQNSKKGKTLIRLKKQSDLGLGCLSRLFWWTTSVQNFRTFTVTSVLLYKHTCTEENLHDLYISEINSNNKLFINSNALDFVTRCLIG